jgi:hypothetical protein
MTFARMSGISAERWPGMTDRPASWRMPSPKQMEMLAKERLGTPSIDDPPPDGALPDEYWDSVLRDRAPPESHGSPSSRGG